MRRKLWVAIIIGLFIMPAFATSPVMGMTGSGTVGDPYMIYDVTDLQAMENDLDAYYELANDIDASATSTWNWNAGRGVFEGFDPVGTYATMFAGHLDGSYYRIYDLYMNRSYAAECYAGLFGQASGDATVDDLYIIAADITIYATSTDAPHVGILVGDLAGGWVTNVAVSGSVYVEMTSTHSQTNGVGGLAGSSHFSGSRFDTCCSFADVEYVNTTGYSVTVGGLIGYPNRTTIVNCFARGSVTADSTDISANAGGCFGRGYYAAIWNSYSTGAVSANPGFPSGRLGGFMGSNYRSNCYNCFWDTQTSGQVDSACGTGKNTEQMKTKSTFTDAGWDFVSIWDISATVNNGYPHFQWWYTPFTWDDYEAYQVLWFQPNTIIEGTTLPDRAGTAQNGIITWGDNPAGITINMTGFYSDYSPPVWTMPDDIVTPPQDVVGPTGNQGWTSSLPTLTTNPFYPLISVIASETGIPVGLVWIILATLLLILAMIMTVKYVPHLIITALVGGGIAAFWYAMGIYPFWVIFIFVIMALACIIGERSPTV